MDNHCMNVRSFAKKVLGSILLRVFDATDFLGEEEEEKSLERKEVEEKEEKGRD